MAGRLQAGPEARRYRNARWHADEHHGSGKAEGHGAESAAEVIFPIEAANSMYLAPLAGRGRGRLWRPSWKERRRQASATSNRRCDPRAEAAHRAVAERDVAAVRARDVAGDRQPKPGAALVLVAGIVEPQERLEHLFAQAGRNAGAVVVDRDGEIAVIPMAGDRNRFRVARRVGNEVGKAALERGRLHGDDRQAVEGDGGAMTMALGVAAQFLQ